MCKIVTNKEIIYKTILKNHESVNFHFVGPECKTCFSNGFYKLSGSSVYSRFNTSLKKLSKSYLKYLTEIDNQNHLALGAGYCIDCTEDLNNGMGVARYIKKDKYSNCAEFAITVLDSYQNMGLGTILLCLLIKYGLLNKIKYFYAYVKYDNLPMLKLLDKFDSQYIDKKSEGKLIYTQLKLQNKKKYVIDLLENRYTDAKKTE